MIIFSNTIINIYSQLLDDFDTQRNADTVTSSDTAYKEKEKDKHKHKDEDGSKGKGGNRTKDEEIMQRLTAFASFLITGAR